jgi:hypothetical protein
MSSKSSIRSLIDEWPSRKALAAEIGANTEAVHKWALSGRIPPRWQAKVISAAQQRGLWHVTAEWMILQHGSIAA